MGDSISAEAGGTRHRMGVALHGIVSCSARDSSWFARTWHWHQAEQPAEDPTGCLFPRDGLGWDWAGMKLTVCYGDGRFKDLTWGGCFSWRLFFIGVRWHGNKCFFLNTPYFEQRAWAWFWPDTCAGTWLESCWPRVTLWPIIPSYILEGSLEINLPTTWTDEKAEVGRLREEKRRSKKIREEKESEERRCRCALR